MSNTDIRVVPGPANYFSHPGSLAHLDDFFTPEQLSRAVWIYGERAIEGARPYLPQSFNATGAKHLLFKGHCSERDVTHLVNESGSETSVVIGVGGGAVMDTVKAVARRLGVPFVGIPTIAATCAAWTPLSVWYNDAGQALQFEIFDDANFLVLVEPRIILNAPAEYLLAGIGDTLAKWYEAAVLAPQPESLPLTVRLGLNGALAIRDVLLERSEEALADQQRGEQTQAFRDVVDAIIAGGGMVGGLGERYTRVAAAHAVLDIIDNEALCERAQFLGERLLATLQEVKGWCPALVEARGVGSMIAAEFFDPATGEPSAAIAQKIQQQALEQGLLLLTCGQYGNVIRFLYPLTIPDAQFSRALTILQSVTRL